MSSNVVSVAATFDNIMSDNDVSVDGNGGMWIIHGVIASLSFLGLQLILESVAAVAAVAIIASMLIITFFMMIEKNAYIVNASLMDVGGRRNVDSVFVRAVSAGCERVVFLPALDIWSYESIGRRMITRTSRMSHGPLFVV
jgi:hypothetical protein